MHRTPIVAIAGILAAALSLTVAAGCNDAEAAPSDAVTPSTRPADAATPDAWDEAKADRVAKEKLSDIGYKVTREDGTEPAFTSDLLEEKRPGTFVCAVCELPVYGNDTKYESGTGWPSFWKPLDATHVREVADNSYGMTRTEVECARCGSHLGHVFDDGPQPTGLRHCINGVALAFVPAAE